MSTNVIVSISDKNQFEICFIYEWYWNQLLMTLVYMWHAVWYYELQNLELESMIFGQWEQIGQYVK